MLFRDWILTESANLLLPWRPSTREVTADGNGRLEVVVDPATAPANSRFRLEATPQQP